MANTIPTNGVVGLVNHAGGNYFGFTVARAVFTYITSKALLARALAKKTTFYRKRSHKYKLLAFMFGLAIAVTLPTL